MTKRRFHFKLEPLRTLRENAEQNAMRELAGELEHASSLRSELSSAEQRLLAARDPLGRSSSAAELAVQQVYVERVERELDAARQRAVVQDGHVEQTRARLASAVRERQTLDRLEERRRAAHDLEARRADRNDADEVSLMSHLTSESPA
jgi:flagellar export protein FliJ